jgi:hypothetical protein
MTLRQTAAAFALVGLAAIGSPAQAVVILTLDNPGSTAYQQTLNSPCVIGDPSCNNPDGFGFTKLPAGVVAFYDSTSPTYTVQQIRNIAGDAFFVGIDVNTTTQPLATERLDYFAMLVNGVVQFIYEPASPGMQLVTAHNGNGYSDALLRGFDLAAFLPTDAIAFRAILNSPTAGRDQFFLAAGASVPTLEVPEPGTLGLLGLGLVGITFTRRRSRVAASA